MRRPVIHQLRERRARCGELVQIDGSPHDWFEGRAPKCTLLVFVDDATSRLMYLQFVEAETTFNYFAGMRSYIAEFGKPLAFYSDKFGVFRVKYTQCVVGHRPDAVWACPQRAGHRVDLCALTTSERPRGARQSDVAGPADQRAALARPVFTGGSQRLLAGVYGSLQRTLCSGPSCSRVSASAAQQRRGSRAHSATLRAAHVIEKPDPTTT